MNFYGINKRRFYITNMKDQTFFDLKHLLKTYQLVEHVLLICADYSLFQQEFADSWCHDIVDDGPSGLN